jgi:hypothetical protein
MPHLLVIIFMFILSFGEEGSPDLWVLPSEMWIILFILASWAEFEILKDHIW